MGPQKTNLTRALLLSCQVILILSIVILCWVPPVSRDALVHHLAVPKLYLRHGGMYELPSLRFSYYPMNLELLYLVALFFGNGIIPKYIHFAFALLTARLIYRYLSRRLNSAYALFGSLFFLSTPIIVKLSITAYVDLGLIFFSTASLLLLLQWMEDGFTMRPLILSAIFCGLAAGTKYSGLITILLLSLFVPFVLASHGPRGENRISQIALQGWLFFSISILLFSPWMIRNYLWTHNPIYPLYDKWFNPESPTDQNFLSLFTYRSQVYGESWPELVLLPVRIFFQGKDGNPQFFDGELNPFLLVFAILGLFPSGSESPVSKRQKNLLFAFVSLFFLFALFSATLRIRYISPIIPAMVILDVLGVRRAFEIIKGFKSPRARWTGKIFVYGLLGLALGLNAQYVFRQYMYVKPFDYLCGKIGKDQYIERFRGEYPALQFINANLPENSRILFLFIGGRGYYCDRDYVLDMVGNRSTLEGMVKDSADSEPMRMGLERMGITHLLINVRIFDKWASQVFSSEKEKEKLSGFFKKCLKLIYFSNGYGVYALSRPC